MVLESVLLGLPVRVASGVDTEFPYRVRIVDSGLIAATLFADTVSDSKPGVLFFSEQLSEVRFLTPKPRAILEATLRATPGVGGMLQKRGVISAHLQKKMGWWSLGTTKSATTCTILAEIITK